MFITCFTQEVNFLFKSLSNFLIKPKRKFTFGADGFFNTILHFLI